MYAPKYKIQQNRESEKEKPIDMIAMESTKGEQRKHTKN